MEMHLTVVGGCQIFVLGLVYIVFFYIVGVLGRPNGSIFCILYWFHKCFVKIDVRVCAEFPRFEFCLFYEMFLIIFNFVYFI